MRIFTGNPALWFAHCHLHAHREDGMAFILNVGNFRASKNSTRLENFPKCDTPYLESKKKYAACDCFQNKDALLQTGLTEGFKCSSGQLCYHEVGPHANISPVYP